jgi:tRNA pseudouridine55 synthase
MARMNSALVIDKPAGITSHDVVARVRKILGVRRVGHTGTLDPFATGVLVVLVGRATRLAQFLSGAEKEYEAVIRLGYATDTGDSTGQRVVSPSPQAERGLGGEVNATQPHPQSLPTCGEGRNFNAQDIEAAMASLRGTIEQTPPMYSAKKIEGRKLYELARRGEEVERQTVRVTIHEFEGLGQHDDLLKVNEDATRDLRVRVVCSAGTYVRTLAEDLGKKLGIGAHLAELRRTRAGRFRIEHAFTLERLDEMKESSSFGAALISPHDALSHLGAIELDEKQRERTMHGLDLQIEPHEVEAFSNGDPVRLSNGGELIAVGTFDQDRHVIHPAVVLTNA